MFFNLKKFGDIRILYIFAEIEIYNKKKIIYELQ